MAALLTIGTRGSPLAMAQTAEVRRRLCDAWPELQDAAALGTEVIRTTGDSITDRPLADIGGKGLFTKEIDEALLDRRVDLAVHSLKDVPTWLPDGLAIVAVLPRVDPRDAWFARGSTGLGDLPVGAVVGTASLRRQAQLLAQRPDLKVVPLRGNVGTRLAKLEDGVVDATLLAVAGITRLGRAEAATAILDPSVMLPSAAQGAIGIVCRADDTRVSERLAPLHCAPSHLRVVTERAMLESLEGSCRTPIGALATLDGDQLLLDGLVAGPDGRRIERAQARGAAADAYRLGRDLGDALRVRARDILAAL